MQIKMPKPVKKIVDTLIENGYEAYIVGGCVRDSLLGVTPCDYDVSTNATPKKVAAIFEKTVATGIKHGTVTVIAGDTPVEVTTFRTESEYRDHRHPDEVLYVDDLKSDLSRRDFTVNAMCYNDAAGLIDIYGGEDDIKAKILRAVGDPDTRFKEDALRILRLFRFASTLKFTPESQTLSAAIKNAKLLKEISAERIREELIKLSCGFDPAQAAPLFETAALPGFKANKDIQKIPLLGEKRDLRFFALLYLCCDDLPAALDYLKCSNAFKKYALSLKAAIPLRFESRADIKRILNMIEGDIFDLLSFDAAILSRDTGGAAKIASEIIKTGEPYKISQLNISGDDIAALGIRGKNINAALLKLLDAVTENPALNRKETLLSLIQSN